jgi:hypothetical protein
MTLDREDFGARQAEMTARWYENIKSKFGDVEAYIESRRQAYDMPLHLDLGLAKKSTLEIGLIGKSPASRWSQFVFRGYLWR